MKVNESLIFILKLILFKTYSETMFDELLNANKIWDSVFIQFFSFFAV